MEALTRIRWLIVILLCVIVFVMVLRRSLKKKLYKFKMVFRAPGVDKHMTIYGDDLDSTHTIDSKTYEIKAERLYRLRPRIARRLWNKFRGIKASFIIIYQHRKTNPLAPVEVKVSARILKEVSESRALDKALRSEFSVPWDLKKILMVMGFLVVAVAIWVLMSGEINI